MTWNFHAYRMNGDGTKTKLASELPITGPKLKRQLSGPGTLTGTITPEIARLRDEDGNPIFLPWSTAIFAEKDGRIRDGWLLLNLLDKGPELSLDTTGFTGYAKDMPYRGDYVAYETDPLDIVRHIWLHIRDKKGADLGISLDAASSGVRLGIPERADLTQAKIIEARAEAAMKRDKQDWENAKNATKNASIAVFKLAGLDTTDGELIYQETAPSGSRASKKNLWKRKPNGGDPDDGDNMVHTYDGDEWNVKNTAGLVAAFDGALKFVDAEDDAKKVYDKANEAYQKAKAARQKIKGGEAEPYTLSWWEHFDLGGELDQLAKDTPFDYRMDHGWNTADPEDIVHILRLGYPRLGTRQHDLRFVVGENVSAHPTIEQDGEDYASEVIVLGSGEGRKMVRATADRVSSRLYRAVVVDDKTIKSAKRAQSEADRELTKYIGGPDITQIVVRDHKHAPVGSYDVGDYIFVQTIDGWHDSLGLWCRVLAITLDPESDNSTLDIIRAEKA